MLLWSGKSIVQHTFRKITKMSRSVKMKFKEILGEFKRFPEQIDADLLL